MIHISKIKKTSSSLRKIKNQRNKIGRSFLKLPQLNFIKNVKILNYLYVFTFVLVTLIIFGVLSYLNSSSSFETLANQENETRVITNFYYNQNKSNNFQAEPIK